MPISRKTPRQQTQRAIYDRLDRLIRGIIKAMCRAGEDGLKYARSPERQRYKDRTGNLTSSIGYCVLEDGQPIVMSEFALVPPKANPKNGKPYKGGYKGGGIGKRMLEKLCEENSQGLVLIMVAGMPYAEHVEKQELDVLASAEDVTKEMLQRLLAKIKF